MLSINSYTSPYSVYLNTGANEEGLREKVTTGDILHSQVADGYEVFVKETSIPGVYSYGAKQLEDDYCHPAGYVWSSRCSVINGLFDMKLTEVSINSVPYGMDINMLKDMLEDHTGKEFTVTRHVRSDEVSYSLQELT